jgi:hypothetical protein
MPPARVTLASQIGRKVIGAIISVVGLLIVRGVVGALPMLKNAPPIESVGITPLMIAQAIVNTLIFVALLRFGVGLSSILRAGYPAFPDSGPILNLVVITGVVAWAYSSYSDLSLPLLRENQQFYGWVFLVLVIAPVFGILVLTARNMDTITELLFKTARGTAAPPVTPGTSRCPQCGHAVAEGKKFCPQCGSAVNRAPEPPPATSKKCPSCGAENSLTAKFCDECGASLVGLGAGA